MKKQMLTSLLTAGLLLGTIAPAVPAFAETPTKGTITIRDTQKDATYSAYKIFDATVDGGAVSYTIPKDATYDTQAQAFTNLFEIVKNGDTSYVVRKTTASDADIAAWAKTAKGTQPVISSRETQGDAVETLSVDYGYYYIETSVNAGSTVMVTSASPTATIHEKNSNPGWGDAGYKRTDHETYSVGDTITYTLNYTNAVNYNKGQKVFQYVVKDVMPAEAVALNNDSIKVFVNDVQQNKATSGTVKGTYIEKIEGNSFTITIPWATTNAPTAESKLGAKDDFYYEGVNTIRVEYTGVLKSAAVEGSNNSEANKNKATINPNNEISDGGKEAFVYDGEITIKKVDGADQKALKGAKFVLKNEAGDFLNFKDKENVEWVKVQSEASVFETGTEGTVTISGLAAGTYRLVEIEAPAGYNLLKGEKTVVLAKRNGTVGEDTLVVESKVENNKGTELPSTGGMGTMIFYTVGASLVVGASVVLIARRRAQD